MIKTPEPILKKMFCPKKRKINPKLFKRTTLSQQHNCQSKLAKICDTNFQQLN
jgi:hypothetical protein